MHGFIYDPHRQRITLTLQVQPGARSSAFAGLHGDALKLRIAAPAVENKANTALVNFLSLTLGVHRTNIEIRHGGKGRRKIVDINQADDALAARLQTAVSQPPR